MESYLDVATLTGKKNLDGRLVAKSAPGLPFLLTEGMQVRLVPPVLDAPRSVKVASVSAVDDGCAVVAFSEVTDASVAEALVGCHCLVGRSALGAQAAASAAMSAASIAMLSPPITQISSCGSTIILLRMIERISLPT